MVVLPQRGQKGGGNALFDPPGHKNPKFRGGTPPKMGGYFLENIWAVRFEIIIAGPPGGVPAIIIQTPFLGALWTPQAGGYFFEKIWAPSFRRGLKKGGWIIIAGPPGGFRPPGPPLPP